MSALISSQPYFVSATRRFATTPEAAYDALVAAPLEEILVKRVGPIPPIAATTKGPWGSVGDSREVRMSDGGSMVETLVGADRPADYRYELTGITGPMKLLVARVEGRFTFAAENDGTRVTWSWLLHPAHTLTRPLLPVLGTFWRPMAEGLFDRLGDRLV